MIINDVEVDSANVIVWLDKLLTSQLFITSYKHQNFLRYLVECTLDGKADRLKGYSIGVDALGRSADFDPNQDAIVRVEASRLRAKLSAYYQSDGEEDEVQFHLVKGSYQIFFHLKTAEDQTNNGINHRAGSDRRSVSSANSLPIDLIAQAAYLRGLEQYLMCTEVSMHAAKALFLLALEYDANHALAHAWLSRTLSHQCMMRWETNDEIIELADYHACQALKINPSLPPLITSHRSQTIDETGVN